MSARFGKGYLPDPYDPRDLDASMKLRLGFSDPRQAKASLLDVRGVPLYQDGVGMCTGFALARATYMSLAAQDPHGLQPPMPSPQFYYANGRRQRYAGQPIDEIPPLEDEGAEPRLVMKAIANLGFVEMHECPFDPKRVNEVPAPQVYQKAYTQKGFAYYRVNQTGDAKVEAVAQALMQRHPVVFGIFVDTAFEAWDGNDMIFDIDTRDPDGGGHMLTALAVGDDRKTVLFDNWWGTDWGRDGLGVISAGLWARMSTDVYVITAVPPYRRAAS